MPSFAEAGVSPRTLAALSKQGITEPVQVQAEAIPALLAGRDVVMEAQTGSGKTLAYLIPLVEKLPRGGPGPRALIVTPTRELALQVEKVLRTLAPELRSTVLYGGVGYATQRLALKHGVDVVVGTPGRIIDLLGQGKLSLSRIQYLVLDEADEMLDAGFAPSVEKILGLTYEPQTVLASPFTKNECPSATWSHRDWSTPPTGASGDRSRWSFCSERPPSSSAPASRLAARARLSHHRRRPRRSHLARPQPRDDRPSDRPQPQRRNLRWRGVCSGAPVHIAAPIAPIVVVDFDRDGTWTSSAPRAMGASRCGSVRGTGRSRMLVTSRVAKGRRNSP